MSAKFEFIDQVLDQRQRQHQRRVLRSWDPLAPGWVQCQGRSFLNFSSNDYLGLSQHPYLVEMAQEYTQRYGTGATASRLVTGNYSIHQTLEDQMADFLGREAALLFSSGFQANSTLIPTLVDRHSLVLADRLIHHSLLQGILLSQAQLVRYRHNDYQHLEALLKQHQPKPYNRRLIVSESLFSMDGDFCNLAALVGLSQAHDTWLYLDEAHALGVWGPEGRGLAWNQPGVDVVVGTFGKAFGSFGAVAAASQRLKDYWLNGCGGVIYTTALPPGVVGSVTAALALMPSLGDDRDRLIHHSQQLHQDLMQLGFLTGVASAHKSPHSSHILPILLGDPKPALALAQYLETAGILALAIRAPTVPRGSDRLRLALSSAHRPEDYQRLMDALRQWLTP